jgi:hypothetical protein
MRLDGIVMRLQLRRAEYVALAALALLLFGGAACVGAGLVALRDARAEGDQRRLLVSRLAAARAQTPGAQLRRAAPAAAFIDAPTVGQANAQLQAHVARLVAAHGARLSSFGAAPVAREEADAVRLQATFDVAATALQALLYALETRTPYVFVEALTAQTQRSADAPLRVTTTLRALLLAPGAAAVAQESTPLANPLAQIPLADFAATRERPLFAPTRRPPPPAMRREAPPAPPPEPPTLRLLGVVRDGKGARALTRSGGEKIRVLRLGDEANGWRVVDITPRRILFARDARTSAATLFDGKKPMAPPGAKRAPAPSDGGGD